MLSSDTRHNNQIQFSFYAGVFMLSFCLLSTEILLTRIMSVLFWYHFAFMVVSVVLFGMTVGALIVYLFPRIFLPELTIKHIAVSAYVSSLAILVSLLLVFYIPLYLDNMGLKSTLIPVLYFFLSFPFISVGICLSLILSRFPEKIGRIYSANLTGSAVGCIGIIFILNNFEAASAVLFIAALSAVSTLFFAWRPGAGGFLKTFSVVTILLCIFFSVKNERSHLIRPVWVKGVNLKDFQPLYSRWNFFSYLTVRQSPQKPFGWGFSPRISEAKINTTELMMVIDEGAGTVFTRFNNLSDMEYLRLDISSMAYYVRNIDNVLVIGSGGGRDLLTAVLFGAKSVTGVEINKDINDIVYNRYRNFSGNINNFEQIHRVTDEGRSFVSRSKEKYSIIQASLVDSFAAYANGAFALTENSLYTKDAWVIFLEHLKERGILTFSRWYDIKNLAEIYRTLALAKSSLEDIGVKNPKDNIMLVRYPGTGLGVGTIIVSKTPFSDLEIANLGKICSELGFEFVLSPKHSNDKNFSAIMEDKSNSYVLAGFPYNISPPTDDKPFFFYFSRFGDIFSKNPLSEGASVLKNLFLTILIFGIIFIIVPLIYKPSSRGFGKASISRMIYFAAIGLGFMLIEIPLIQRLGIYLGHPVYGLTVVLFSLLFACGIGSYFTKALNSRFKIILLFASLISIIVILMLIMPIIIKITTPALIEIKIIVSVVLLMAIGLFMGMPFPVGMMLAQEEKSPRVLYWGINGFTSVCGSALAAIIMIHFGFQSSLIAGLICYAAALLSLLPAINRRFNPPLKYYAE